MRFYKLSCSISKDNITNSKVEYFWHFWDFLFTINRDLILVDEPKFTSQISLLNKIEKHLEWNNGINSKKLAKYCNHHLYFKQKNLILRTNPVLKETIKELKTDIDNFDSQNRHDLLQSIKTIKKDYFKIGEYSKIIIKKLLKIILSNKDLNDTTRKDLKFLCNSIIDILILKGYSLKFINGLLSNIIFHPSNKFKYKYKKKDIDFETFKDWEKYVEDQYKLITLEDRINYLKYFLVNKKNKGYFIFKVEGIRFESRPIEIFGVKFYNPFLNSFLKFYKTDDSLLDEKKYMYYSRTELFHTENEIFKDLNAKDSTCNAIVPIEYFTEDIDHFDSFKFPTKSFIEAYNRAQISFIEFKRYLKTFSIKYLSDEDLFFTRISKESTLTDYHFNYHKSSIIQKSKDFVFKLDGIRNSMISESLNYKKKIKSQNTFFNHIANSNALISEYMLENYKFNFKSLWIECLEPYFKDPDEFIDFAKKSIRIRSNFFSDYRLLLYNALRNSFFRDNAYSLDETEMKNIGIGELKVGERILGDTLEKNFELLPKGSLLDEFKAEMRLFIND